MSTGSLGAVIDPVPLTDVGDEQTFPVPGAAAASFTLVNDGTLSKTGNTSTCGPNWFSPTLGGVGSSFWVRVTKTAGTNNTTGAALGVWLSLSAGQSWGWAKSGLGSISATITVDIATDALGANIVATQAGIPVLVNVTP